ncbi:hypothetical protein VKT23_002662 [Stygiomarasmius scandens]|uniref:Uncharacterized protein n=1 Tax=Marasmiellus scandens TaxID=2682957 RepID=A0ABR1K329_9AGAR
MASTVNFEGTSFSFNTCTFFNYATTVVSSSINDPDKAILDQLKKVHDYLKIHANSSNPPLESIQQSFNDFLMKYTTFFTAIIEGRLDARSAAFKARAEYLTSLATVATFLAGVQIGFIQVTSQLDSENLTQKVIDIFSSSAICFDILGAIFALTVAHSRHKISHEANHILLEKVKINRTLGDVIVQIQKDYGPEEWDKRLIGLESMIEKLAEQVKDTHRDLMRQDHIMEKHSTGYTDVFLVIILGVLCFFVSLLGYLVHTRPQTVWIPTMIVSTGQLMKNEWQNHPAKIRTWFKLLYYHRRNMMWTGNRDVENTPGQDANEVQKAVEEGRLGRLKSLIAKKADIPDSVLQTAVKKEYWDIVKYLIEQLASQNPLGEGYGVILQAAIEKERLDVVKVLLKNKTNFQGGEYGAALQAAAYKGNLDIVKALIGSMADPKFEGEEFGAALQAAAGEGYLEVVKFLVEMGADVNLVGGFFGTALQAAAGGGHLEVVEFLVEMGADVNLVGGFFGTALQAATAKGHLEVVKFLVQNNANVNAVGGSFGTALQAAAGEGYLEVVKFLVEMGADVNAMEGSSGTALQAAVNGKYSEVVEFLVKMGADVNAVGGPFGMPLVE